VETLEYAPRRLVDLFGASSQPPVLLWHGMQPDARAVVRPLAEFVASHGICVVVPDWNSHADDGGKRDLLQSVEFARGHTDDSDRLVIVGWSMGGLAAAGLTVQAARFDLVLSHTICLAGAFMATDPISGGKVTDGLSAGGDRSPFTLMHGVADDVVPVAASRAFATRLEQIGWPVEVIELATDHGAIAGARYDPIGKQYLPAADSQTREVAGDVAARIAAVVLGR
jgi:predicted peptidase